MVWIIVMVFRYFGSVMSCYNCKFKGGVAGSTHSRCNLISSIDDPKSFELEILLASGMYQLTDKNTNEPLVKLNPHGVKNGWAAWPINFDPIWVESCRFETTIENG